MMRAPPLVALAPGERPRVLVVSCDLAVALQAELAALGVPWERVSGLRQAREALRSGSVALVLMASQLEDGDAVDWAVAVVAGEVRVSGVPMWTSDVPFVLLPSRPQDDGVVVTRSGAREFVASRLVVVVTSLLRPWT